METNLNNLKPKVRSYLTKNPNTSLSVTFRRYRKQESYSLFGDFPILSLIIRSFNTLGKILNRDSIRRAIRCSQELKGRKLLIRQLFESQLTIRNLPKLNPEASYTLNPTSSLVKLGGGKLKGIHFKLKEKDYEKP